MIPILYNSTTKDFSNNGLGALTDCSRCEVTEERNGVFELEMDYPISGIHASEIGIDMLIKVKPNEKSDNQLFRIYQISTPIGGVSTIYAKHISYQRNSIVVSPFSASSAASALSGMITNTPTENPFTVWTDVTKKGNFKIEVPSVMGNYLGGTEGSILDVFGGEYEWDNYLIRLRNNRGSDSGVTILYGKNLIDLEQEKNIANIVTGVYPYWQKDDVLMELPEKVIQIQTVYSYPRITTLDLSGDFDERPTEAQMRDKAKEYINQSGIAEPKVSITMNFAQLWQTEEYKNDPLYKQIAGLERLGLCDIATIQYEKLGVNVKAKIVKYVWDVLLERYNSMELGNARTNLSDAIISQQQEIEQKPSVSFLEQAVINATKQITGVKGGYVVLNQDANGQPYEILIMDKPEISKAVNIWRWNLGGLGHSSNGYEGNFGTAITQDGKIVADFITTGTLLANLIKAGVIQSQDGRAYFNLDTGQIAATQLIAQNASYGQYSAFIGQAATGGVGFVLTRNNNMFLHVNSGGTNSVLALYGGNSRAAIQASDSGFQIEYKFMNVISVPSNQSEIQTPIKTLRIGGADITPSECYTGTFSVGSYRLSVKNGLITALQAS